MALRRAWSEGGVTAFLRNSPTPPVPGRATPRSARTYTCACSITPHDPILFSDSFSHSLFLPHATHTDLQTHALKRRAQDLGQLKGDQFLLELGPWEEVPALAGLHAARAPCVVVSYVPSGGVVCIKARVEHRRT